MILQQPRGSRSPCSIVMTGSELDQGDNRPAPLHINQRFTQHTHPARRQKTYPTHPRAMAGQPPPAHYVDRIILYCLCNTTLGSILSVRLLV